MVTATVDEMHWRVPSQHGEMGHEVLMQHEEGLNKGMIEIRPKTRHHLCTVLHVCSGRGILAVPYRKGSRSSRRTPGETRTHVAVIGWAAQPQTLTRARGQRR